MTVTATSTATATATATATVTAIATATATTGSTLGSTCSGHLISLVDLATRGMPMGQHPTAFDRDVF